MSLGNQTFTMTSGDTFTLNYTVRDAAGVAIDLTNATVKWQLARSVKEGALISKVTGNSPTEIELTTPESGAFAVYLLPADTAQLAGRYYHEAEVTDAAGTVSTVATGHAVIIQDLIA